MPRSFAFRAFSALASPLLLNVILPVETAAQDRFTLGTEPERERIQELWNKKFATGDWGGLRPRLKQHGLEFTGGYTGAVFGIVSGGKRQGAVYNGLLDLGISVDLEKLLQWKGGKLRVSGIYGHGASGTEKFVGDIGTFSSIDMYDSVRLYELWFEQELFPKRVSVRLGLMPADDEFTATDSTTLFFNSGFTQRVGLSANMPFPTQPYSALGVRLKVEPVDGLVFMAGAFDGNPAPGVLEDPSPDAVPSNEFNRHGVDWSLREDEGALLLAEMSYTFNAPDEDEEKGKPDAKAKDKNPKPPRGLAGSYRIGMACHTDSFADIYDRTLDELDSSLTPDKLRNAGENYAIYVSAEQELWREPESEDQGLTAFFRGCWLPRNRNYVEYEIEAGVVYKGLIPGREEDLLGIGYAHYSISDAVIAATHAANVADRAGHAVPDYEAVIEATYVFRIAPGWTVQPDLQYIIHPGGSSEKDDAWVIGLASTITF